MITAGTLLALESGEYSDFGVMGFFRVLKDFDGMETVQTYLKEFPEQAEDYGADLYDFAGWRVKHGYLEDIDYLRWHIGSYGTFHADKDEHKPKPEWKPWTK